jgi:RHS repeat-associated protein
LLADEAVASDGSTIDVYWTLSDHLNTIRDVAAFDDTTDTTSIIDHRTFDSFGNITSDSNGNFQIVFGFTGRYFDFYTSLQNNLNRWYDPLVGLWPSEDPIQDDFDNSYRYVGNGATLYVDPDGLEERPTSALEAYRDARTAELNESRWNIINPAKGSFFVWYCAGSAYYAFASAPGVVSDGFEDARDDLDERYANEEDTLANRAGYAFQKGVLYGGEATAHGGIRLGEIGMTGYVAAHGGPVGPALMQTQTARVVVPCVTTTGTAILGASLIGKWVSGEPATTGEYVDFVLGMHLSIESWKFAFRPDPAVVAATDSARKWLGPNYQSKINSSGDRIFMSQDNLRKIRFDLSGL